MRYTKRFCIECKKEFTVRTVYTKRPGRGIFCSRSCHAVVKNRARKGRPINRNISGENNPNWKGGVSTDNYRYTRRFVTRNPEKVLAHRLVRRAVLSGGLRKLPCEKCGAIERIHAHHEDYSKPLEVVWLCQICHIKHHAQAEKSI